MTIIRYNPKLKELAKNLRNNSTFAEVLLWNKLRGSQFFRYRFIRQKPIGNYIVDFFCKELMLVLEIDGSSHYAKRNKDGVRDEFLKSLGITVLRFGDIQVKQNIQGVLYVLEDYVKNSPLERGGTK